MSSRNDTSDNRLIEAARRGDERAFAALYHRYREYVLIVAARFGVTGEPALDVLQETFFYFFRKLPEFELRARFSTFLYPVVKNLSLKKKADGARLRTFDESGVDLSMVPAGENGLSRSRRVVETVESLPAEQREAALLRFVDGLSLKEIAVALDIPLGTVKSRLHNALAALRRQES